MNPTDPTPLPCPFCGATVNNEDGDHVISHDLSCFFSHQYAQEMWVLGRRKKLWSTRAQSAELGSQSGIDNLREPVETTLDFVCQTKLAPRDVSQTGKQECGTLKPSELVQSSGGFSSERTPRTDAEQYAVSDGPHTYVTAASFARQLETELAQAQAEAAAMREWVQESVVVSMEFADGRVLTKADLLATKHFLPTTTENTKPQ